METAKISSPLTITLPPRLSAAVRFEAAMSATGKSPEDIALDALAEASRGFIEGLLSCRSEEELADELLNP